MKKILICNITMKEDTDKCRYQSNDRSLPVSDREVIYPVNAFLEKTISDTDEYKVVLLVKKDPNEHYKNNLKYFMSECPIKNVEPIIIESEFSEEKRVHESLMGMIVDELEENAHIIADITYGPKDLPIVLFSALGFAEKFLDCEIDNIIYGKADFVGGKPTNTTICDMVPLFYLNAVTNTIRCDDPEKARNMLKSLLSL